MYNVLAQHDRLHKDSRTMPENRLPLSEYKGMWLFAMFDLPVDDAEALPANGHVRILAVTDHQFGKMETFLGRKCSQTEEPPPQLMLF